MVLGGLAVEGTTKRGWGMERWIGLWCALAAPFAMLACSQAFAAHTLPRPAALEPAVNFWKMIYTGVVSDQGVIHDDRDLSRIYGRVSVPLDLGWHEQRKLIDAAQERYRAALEALARHPDTPATPRERRVRTLFPADVQPAALRAAADRLRFQRGLADRFREGYQRSGRWLAHIRSALRKQGVPAALAALPHVESSFRPDAVSHAGAVGLWQFTRHTGRRFLRIDGVVDERLDPWRASEAAARLLASNYAELGSWPLAITAYNHGVAGMKRAVAELGTQDIARIIEDYDGRTFGFASRNFYPALLAAVDVDRNAARYFATARRDPPPQLAAVRLPDFMDARAVESALHLGESSLRALNPALGEAVWKGRKFLPKGYVLHVPDRGDGDPARALAKVPYTHRYAAQRPDRFHRVRRGETLSGIAARYGVGVPMLMAANGIGRRNYLRAGQRLRLPGAGREPLALSKVSIDKGGQLYRVRSGDTLLAIARRFGVDVDRLVAANGIGDPDAIRVGERLRVVSSRSEVVAYSR